MVSIGYVLSALTAVSVVQAAPAMNAELKRDANSGLVQLTANDTLAALKDIAQVNQGLESGMGLGALFSSQLISDLEQLLSSLDKITNSTEVANDSASQTMVSHAVNQTTDLSNNLKETFNNASAEHLAGTVDFSFTSALLKLLKGITADLEVIKPHLPGFLGKGVGALTTALQGLELLLYLRGLA